MKIRFFKNHKLSVGIAMALSLSMTPMAFAQDDSDDGEDSNAAAEEVVVTGTRRAARSATESAVPIDVVAGDEFVNQAGTDLSNLIRNVVPSYNVNTQPISDAATIVRPANLRGLAPDHTLVLVNNKRRHRAAVIYWLGNGVADGAQGPDISPIPSIALKQLEVLRDGSAAQYGSDAIAGVMNFIYNDSSEGSTYEVKYGQFYEGDGTAYSVAGNIGLPFTDQGFMNLSFEYGSTDDTDRSVQRDDAQALIDNGNPFVATPAQIWGQPKIDDDLKLVFNMGAEVGGGNEFYAFGNYAQKDVDGGFYFRNPDTRSGVFAADGIRLIGDTNDNGIDDCAQYRVPAGGSYDQSYVDALIADNNCFSFLEVFPGGFTPRFGGEAVDFSTTFGLKGEFDNGILWDVSAAVGISDVDFVIRNTVNASLGPASPTIFDPGDYTQLDKNFNADFSYPLDVGGFYSPLNVAAGLEWRSETFEITAGDQASFEIGPLAAQGFSSASNGFPGFSALTAGKFERSNVAVYTDLEADVTENFLLGAALRWEDFEDFGTTTNYKISAHYRFTDNFALRSTFSTGFRAPTPGQSNAFNVSTEFDLVTNELVNNGTIPSINPVAQLRGGQPLDPEESENFTFGAVFSLGPVDFTVDYFKIDLEDRITLSQNFSLTPEEVDNLIASGVTSAGNLRNFRFFTNAFDTETTGVDVVATYKTEIGNGNTDFSLIYNNTDTEVTAFDPLVVDATRIRELQEGLPETRWNLQANHMVGNWRFLGRYSYYDEFFDSEDGATYGDEYILDAEVAYTFNDKYTFTIGAQNLLDEYPDRNLGAAAGVGNQYSQFSPSGFGGGFYYLKLRYDLF